MPRDQRGRRLALGVVLGATVRSRDGKATVCPYYNALRRQS